MFTALLSAREVAAGEDPERPAADPASEWEHDLTAMRRYVDGGLEGYRNVRSALFAAFGALEVGWTEAIRRLNTFYEEEIVRAEFFGHQIWGVHQEMKRRLEGAADKLRKAGKGGLGHTIRTIGGINIRPDVNNPLTLSEHSFGADVDINALQSEHPRHSDRVHHRGHRDGRHGHRGGEEKDQPVQPRCRGGTAARGDEGYGTARG
ncbi:MAG: hypothetical protein ACRD0K_00350 [Egibacteraceae bacterium]